MTKRRIAAVVGSVGAIVASGLAFAMWMANGIVYGSLVGLKNREHDLAIARDRAMIALTAALLLQVLAMFTTASWLPRGQFGGAARTAARFVFAFVISVAGAAMALALILQISRFLH